MANAEFQARIDRIHGRAQRRGRKMMGRQESEMVAPPSKKQNVSPVPESKFGNLVMLVLAFACGVAAVVFARWAQFQYGALPDAPPLVVKDYDFGPYVGTFVGDLAIALVAVFLLRHLFNLKTKWRRGAELGGLMFGLFVMGELVLRAPDAFAAMFSPEWVNTVLASV